LNEALEGARVVPVDCSAVGEFLPQIVSGRLPEATADHVTRHLTTCPACAERVANARAGRRTPTDRVPIPPTVAARPSSEAALEAGSSEATIKYGSDLGTVEAEPGPGTAIGGYIIIDVVARGGMGIVYRANQTHMNRVVALKVLPRHALEDEELVLRFIREARAAAELNHPNVVRIYDIGRDAGWIWYSMEYVSDRSLKTLIQEHGRLSTRVALDAALGCARALEAAEAHAIVHRDVKPDNLLVTKDGQVKLADLGLVRRELAAGSAELTRQGDLLGTPSYMAPEQARDSRIADNRSDLWSLGATLYHALFGVPPFLARSPLETISRLLAEEVRYPPEMESLSRELRTTLRKLLEKDPRARFQTAREVVGALEHCRAEGGEKRRSSAARAVGQGSDHRRLAAAPRIRGSSGELPSARGLTRRRRVRKRNALLPLIVLGGAAGAAAPFLLAAHRAPADRPDEPAETRIDPPAFVASSRSSDAKSGAVQRPPGREEPPPPEPPAPFPTPSLPTKQEAPADEGARHALYERLRACDDLAALEEGLGRVRALADHDPAAALVARELEARLDLMKEQREELHVEATLWTALEPIRRPEPAFALAREECAAQVAPLDTLVATELHEALEQAEDLIDRARRGLEIGGPEKFELRNGQVRTGRFTLKEGVANGPEPFLFPHACTVEAIDTLAHRERGKHDLRQAEGAWALLENDLHEAHVRLGGPWGASEPLAFGRLLSVLARRERHARLPGLVLADLLWAGGQHAAAVQLYQKALAGSDVLEEEERQRAAERSPSGR
jgi:tRNA A-37 threonylcarbamoyl transferase component Bud32